MKIDFQTVEMSSNLKIDVNITTRISSNKAPATGHLIFVLTSVLLLHSCYYSVQTLLSSRILSKNLKIIIYKTIVLPVVLYGCETWSLTLREESRLRVFENRILGRIFGPLRDENIQGD